MFIARLANQVLRLRRLCGFSMRSVCYRKGIRWDLDLDEGIDLCIYLLGAYEPKILRAYSSIIKQGDVVFDIGANIGAHTLHFARITGASGCVYAFEPTDYATNKLRANIALNPELIGRIDIQQTFLVADSGEKVPDKVVSRWPVANEHNDLHSDHLGKPELILAASAITADDFCEAKGIERLDFVKIDVDGHEYSVLNGFRKSLKRLRPCILIELAPFVYTNAQSSDFDRFVNLIADLGYRFTDAQNGSSISSDPSILRQTIRMGSSMNCLLFPLEKIAR
jgi:FkbM family methyltransferase